MNETTKRWREALRALGRKRLTRESVEGYGDPRETYVVPAGHDLLVPTRHYAPPAPWLR